MAHPVGPPLIGCRPTFRHLVGRRVTWPRVTWRRVTGRRVTGCGHVPASEAGAEPRAARVAHGDGGHGRGAPQSEPGAVHIGQHGDGVVQRLDTAAADVLPLHRDLGDGQPEAMGAGQHLDIEGEAVDGHEVEQQAGHLGAEGLEPALGVEKVEIGARGHQPVEQPAHQQPDHVPAFDHRVREGPGPDGGFGRDQAIEQQGNGPGVDGHVGIHVGGSRATGRPDAGPNGCALALVEGQPDDAVVGKVGQQGSGHAGGVVMAAVVDHDDLGAVEVDGARPHGVPEPFEAVAQPVGLVEGGYDDAQPECGRRSPARGGGTGWVDRRGRQLRVRSCRARGRAPCSRSGLRSCRRAQGPRCRRAQGPRCRGAQGRAAPTRPPYQIGS